MEGSTHRMRWAQTLLRLHKLVSCAANANPDVSLMPQDHSCLDVSPIAFFQRWLAVQTRGDVLLQLREIVAYAAARHIDIVPEIELPGHCGAALASYPNLSCATASAFIIMLRLASC